MVMNLDSLRIIAFLRKKRPADLARLAGVSRQAVSHWFRQTGEIQVKSSHLKNLAKGLHVKPDVLLNPLPILDDPKATRRFETLLLWDKAFPSLGEWGVAFLRGDLRAMARLVEAFGLYHGAKIAGKKGGLIWEKFPDYKKMIRPGRRSSLEKVWEIRQKLKRETPWNPARI